MSAKIPGKPRGDKSTHKHLSNQFQIESFTRTKTDKPAETLMDMILNWSKTNPKETREAISDYTSIPGQSARQLLAIAVHKSKLSVKDLLALQDHVHFKLLAEAALDEATSQKIRAKDNGPE
ncbi:MAG: hypothetical protein HRT90_03465 [Candidatus Margulisbacteria bacterium]|nr:hypothetical protein [Candidatus Margulisiibacteriota bacterium]